MALTTALLTVLLGLYGWNSVSFLTPATAAVSTAPPSQPSETQQLLAQSVPQQLLQQGREHYTAQQFTEAVNTWSQAERYFANQNDPLNQAIALSNLALAHHQLNQWPEAETAITTSLQLLQSTPELSFQGLRIYGQALNTQGSLYLAQGQTKQALKTWEQATEIYTQADYPEGIIKSLINQTFALRSLGFFLESQNRLDQVEALLAEQVDSPLKIALKRSLGETQRLIGDLKASRKSLEASLDLANTLQVPTELAKTQLSLGKTLQASAQQQETLARRTKQEDDTNKARDQYEQVLDIYQTIPSTAPLIIQLRAQLNQLDILLHQGKWIDAQSVKSSLIADLEKLQLGRPSAFIHMRLARLLMDTCATACPAELQSSKQEIYDLLATARNQAQALNDPIAESYSLGYLGHLYEQEGNIKKQTYGDAQRFTEAALTLTRHQPNLAYQWEWQLGRIEQKQQQQKQQKNQGNVLKYYSDAFQHVQEVRKDLLYVESDIQFNFRDQIEPLYREYISLLLPKEDSSVKSDPAQLIQAQKVIDDLRVAELASFLACGLIEPDDNIQRATIQQVAETDKKTAIIYPIILPDTSDTDRLEVLLQLPDQTIKRYYPSQSISANSSKASSTNTNVSITQEKLEQFRKELEQPYFSTTRGEPLAAQIYDWLIRPAEDQGWLKSIDTLVFVLDGAFRNVPMAALYDQQMDKFLIEKYAISVTFGDLQLPVTSPENSLRVLAAGLSKDPSPSSDTSESGEDFFGPLVYVQNEIESINKNIKDTLSFLDQAFTPGDVQDKMSSAAYNIVHLATHGEFGFTRDETFLLAADPDSSTQSADQAIKVKPIDLNSFDTLLKTRNQTPIDLLVLSACETATGDNREVLGIAGLAVQSGARSTLASLWSIHDLSTSQLMDTFYSELLNPEISAAKALQTAQVKLIREGYLNPSRWAPYILVGDWR
ncbi:CHAT domain-containing protein [Leptothoe kymatousa]|nr:CHAT domain-containing protein [Leptothoe kymatousa]